MALVRRLVRAFVRLWGDLDRAERVVLAVVAVLHLVAIGWGLPSTEGWDVDGIAPRDFLPGVVQTFTPGDHFTYPPLHLLLLTLLTLPITLVELVRAPSLAPADIVATFLSVPVMTAFALIARLTSWVMSLGVVLAIGRMAKTIFPSPRARAWAMAIAGVEAAGTYYAHTTNLDLPALFWASLALLTLVEALQRDEPRRLRRVAVLAACAIATKDQAYANFALTMPIALLLWLRARPPGRRAELVRESVLCAAIAIGLVLFIDGAVFNPTGFAARVRFLTGPASQDFAQHSRDLAGRVAVLEDAVTFFPNHYPLLMAPLLLLGIGIALRRTRGTERVAALVPLLVVVSFTVAFNCVARRVEERFMLPQMQMLAVYGGGIGFAVDRLRAEGRARLASTIGGVGVVAVLLGLRLSATILSTMLGDSRYDAEKYLREHVAPGESIEVYGNNVYLPRLPRDREVTRVDPRPVKSRNPIPGVREEQDRLSAVEERRPRWIVIGMGYAWRYLQAGDAPSDGHVLPETQHMNLSDVDTRDYFRALVGGKTAYEEVHVSRSFTSTLLPAHAIHASTGTETLVFRRRDE